ncbi:hypothetical protein LPB19_00370 [Marinobacter salinisoli]|uniref:Lipase chaperone n=1 Tax=Marinobacter salinisoli TaxID=2769486 RepID=A0ABX7MRD4_9GAMM|nr:hypothetical protein [Marinobacter salinisoli]QSP94917.1 hypothetical protein LPB19_00370 [Marinobacter salinisoli]
MTRFKLASVAIGGTVVIAAAAAIWIYTTDTPNLAEQAPAPKPGVIAIPQAVAPDDPAITLEQQQLLQAPETLTFARQLEFQGDVRAFFQQADRLTMEELTAQAAALKAQLTDYEEADQVTAAEALLVRIAIAKLEYPDEAEQKAAAEALIEHYQAESDARHQAWLAEPKPRFEAYKRQEKQIVEEVMGMQSIPGGLDRSEYLRQRLQQARIAAENSSGTR